MTVTDYRYLIIVLTFTYLITLLTVPINIRLSKKYGLISYPNARSIHSRPIPTGGGLSFGIISIAMQFILGFIFIDRPFGILLIKLAGISILLLIFGYLDDKYQSKARYKLLWQIVVAILMYLAGYRVTFLTNPLGEYFLLGWMSLPLTIFWFLLTMNAINLIDGSDGLAAGITCIVSLVLFSVGFMAHNMLVLILTIILFASNLAFLKYNFFPARIFMGDSGSLVIGLNIAAISTASTMSFKGITTLTLIVPVIAMAIPLLDIALAFSRRIGRGSIFQADKAHLHHYLLERGFSQKNIAILSYFLTFLFGLAAIGFSFTSHKIVFSVMVIFMSGLIVLSYLVMHQRRKP